jgi:hypothetical protein
MSSICMSLLPRTTLHSDSEHYQLENIYFEYFMMNKIVHDCNTKEVLIELIYLTTSAKAGAELCRVDFFIFLNSLVMLGFISCSVKTF